LASNFINAVKSRGDEAWACTQKGLSELNTKTNTWVTYRPGGKTQRGEILLTGADGRKHRMESATTLAHNYILNLDFQGDDIWVATANGLSHGMRRTAKQSRRTQHEKRAPVEDGEK
ncbi:MAG TPA: hypothetical protein VFN62_11110, partial [Acidobacteriaceae bacterium]|nr:hypothetical protein [Acidobacteriaceae bacterium]